MSVEKSARALLVDLTHTIRYTTEDWRHIQTIHRRQMEESTTGARG